MDLPWLTLLNDSITGKPDGPVLMSLATIDSSGGADVRRVVCREIGADGTLWFTSDSRSGKNAQISAEPRVALELWLPSVRSQFRFKGTMQIVSRSADRLRFWHKLAIATRETFFWPAPGAKRNAFNFKAPADGAVMPETFSCLRFEPHTVDLLELLATPHRRRAWEAASNWQAQELNP